MSKSDALSLFRTLLTALGAFLAGKHIFGQTVDANLWTTIGGIVLSVFSTVWGFFDKTVTLEGFQSVLRSVVIFVGGFLVAKGTLTQDQLMEIVSGVLIVAPFIYSALSKRKTTALVNGTLQSSQLKAVKKAA